jgi:transposase
MRKIREVLRLLWDQGRTAREVAKSCSLARSTVKEYERRAIEAGLEWPLPDVDDAALEGALFPPPPALVGPVDRSLPNWDWVDKELRRKGVTRGLLWREYRGSNPDGYSYTRYCELFQAWRGLQGLSMRQTHIAGEKVFVDYAGQTLPIVDRETGEVREAQLFVAALGASHYTFAEVTWTQALPDWIASHVRMLDYYGATPRVLVPDNTKVAITSAHRYEPELNPTYLEFARHYGLAVIPARSRKPKDKGVVESAVQVAERWILARLRNRTFFNLFEANDAIWLLLREFNERPFQARPGSRHSHFLEFDQPAMQPLPRERFVFATWKKVRPHLDYHVTIDQHHYSVPFTLVGKQLDARTSSSTIEVYHHNKRVASHVRSHRKGGFTTVREHMPIAHQEHAGMNKEQFLKRAERVGPNANAFVHEVISTRAHPEQAFRSCLGVLRLGKTYGNERLEAACARAVTLGSFTYKSLESILKNGLDQQPLDTPTANPLPKARHANVRGSTYFATSNHEGDPTGEAAC